MALNGTRNGMRARKASSSFVSRRQSITAGSAERGAALASEASGQRGDFIVRAPDARPEPGSPARATTKFSVTVMAGTEVKCW